ncbi:COX15/CtaA family protein [Piscinibacter sp.]|uniref:COX15/CtaA family protein n=1 Tax=Piscinibacter sp. TaxID=1903157 RepID=UPI0039E43492
MDAAQPLYDLSPLLRMALLGGVLALGPLAWLWLRHRDASPAGRAHALTLLVLFLTFDLVVFGAFTRLSDSGLGCPDWPGCYGSASPLGAHAEIHAAQSAQPGGPVTHGKAWVEMIHRYLATTVGMLIIVMTATGWRDARRGRAALSPWWATATLAWVCAQGAFGALTVTLKLVPAIVTLHLLGGIGLLALLAVQAELQRPRPLALSAALRRGLAGVAALALLQAALGGWVSTNYAVLACREFPTCQGAWWPAMDFRHGFTLWRALGETKQGDFLPFEALTAIHYTHRLTAYALFAAMLGLAWALRRGGADARRVALALLALAAWQLLSGLSNVVLGWPLPAALAHTAGAAFLIAALAAWLTRAALARHAARAMPALGAPAGAIL